MPPSEHQLRPLTVTEWLICVIAAIGFAFDILRAADAAAHRAAGAASSCSALPPSSPAINDWVGYLLLRSGGRRRHLRPARRLPDRPLRPPPRARLEHPAVRVLGVRGRLLDRRSRCCCSGAAARSSACAWSSWPPSRGWRSSSPTRSSARRCSATRRRSGRSAALMVTGAVLPGRAPTATSLPAVHGGHEAWRYTLMSGVIPAIPLIVIRPFLPESPTWRQKKAGGHAEAPEHRRALPARFCADDDRHDDHDGVQLRRGLRRDSADAAHRAGAGRGARRWRGPRRSRRSAPCSRSRRSAASRAGSLLAFLAVRIVSRRRLLRIFQVPGLILLPLVFAFAATSNLGCSSGASSSCGLADRRRSSASGATTCRASTRPTCAAPARASPRTSAAG